MGTMSELHIPNKRLIKLELQPDFPAVDLNDNNTHMFKQILRTEDGLAAYSEQLQDKQRYIHMIADRALNIMGIKTRYEQGELAAFSRGFASFETINDIVHPPRAYDIKTASARVAELLIDTRDSLEIEMELLITTPADATPPPFTRDKPTAEFELADSQQTWTQNYPNTYEVIVDLGDKQEENMRELHARTAGAHLAYRLQQRDLDAA